MPNVDSPETLMLSYKASSASFCFILSRNIPVTSSRKKLSSHFLSSLDSAGLFMHHADFICLVLLSYAFSCPSGSCSGEIFQVAVVLEPTKSPAKSKCLI